MEAQPKESQKLEEVNLSMKLRCECPGCKRQWTSHFGTSIWYYYFTPKNNLKLKVHVFSQKCEKCGQVGDVKDYEYENDRLAEYFVNDVLIDHFDKDPYFEEKE